DGERLGKEVFGNEYETQLADHIDYCLKTDYRCHDHDANWRRRCRALQRNPQLRLDLRPRGPQLNEVIEPNKKRGKWGRRTVQDVARELAEAAPRTPADGQMRDVTPPAPSSPEDRAKVQASLDRFLRGGSKEASG